MIKKRTIFLENAKPIISDICLRYNLNEKPSEIFEKIKQGKLPKKSFLIRTALDLYQNKISYNDLPNLLQQNLEVIENEAKNLAVEIKEKLAPLATDIEDQEEKPDETESVTKIKPPISISEIIEEEKSSLNKNTEGNEDIVPERKKPKRIKKSSLPKKTEEIENLIPKPKQQKAGPDSYREPIE